MRMLLAVSLVIVSSMSEAELDVINVAEMMRHNVVTLDVELENNPREQGFGWIIGQDEKQLFIVTADHVVRGEDRMDSPKAIDVRLFDDPTDTHSATLSQASSLNNYDIAVVTIPLPNRQPWLYASMSDEIQIDMPVSFVGKSTEWSIPERAGIISAKASNDQIADEGFDFVAQKLALDVGTSGAPLISKNGIVGMIVTHSIEGTGIVSIEKIKDMAEESKINWGLSEFNTPYKLGGVWAPKTANIPAGIRLEFSPIDAAHFDYILSIPGETQYTHGVGVVDGETVRIWQPMMKGEESFGEFGFELDEEQSPNEVILMQGDFVHGSIETRVRLAKLKNDTVDPRSARLMLKNPSMIESFAKRLIDASQQNGTGEGGIPLGLNEDDKIVLSMGMGEGILVKNLYKETARNRIVGIKFSIKNFDMQHKCFVAKGNISSKSSKDIIDKILGSTAQQASEGLENEYTACNETIVLASKSSASNAHFDLASELVQPQALLDAMMPGVNLSVDGECLLATGKLPSPMHKMLLTKAMSDLAKQLSNKSNSKIVTCDKTSI
jgi:hypothetical protein